MRNHHYYHTYSEHPLIPTHEESWVIENLLNNNPLPAIYDTVLRTNPRGDQKQHKHLYTYTEDQIGRRTYMTPPISKQKPQPQPPTLTELSEKSSTEAAPRKSASSKPYTPHKTPPVTGTPGSQQPTRQYTPTPSVTARTMKVPTSSHPQRPTTSLYAFGTSSHHKHSKEP